MTGLRDTSMDCDVHILDIVSFAEHDVVAKRPIHVQVDLTNIWRPSASFCLHILHTATHSEWYITFTSIDKRQKHTKKSTKSYSALKSIQRDKSKKTMKYSISTTQKDSDSCHTSTSSAISKISEIKMSCGCITYDISKHQAYLTRYFYNRHVTQLPTIYTIFQILLYDQ